MIALVVITACRNVRRAFFCRVWLSFPLFFSATLASAEQEPSALYIPTNDDVIVLTLPDDGMRLAVSTIPAPSQMIQQAQRYLRRAKTEAEPRYASFAQSLLNKLNANTRQSAEFWLLQARLFDYQHNFSAAEAAAKKAITYSSNPQQQAEAYLLLSTISLVQGRLQAAQEHCLGLRSLGRIAQQTMALCNVGIQARSGQAEQALSTLQTLETRFKVRDPISDLLVWIQYNRAEVYAQLQHPETANQFAIAWQTAQSQSGNSIERLHLQLAYADWLLDQRQFAQALQLLASAPDSVSTHLRIARTKKQLQQLDDVLTADIEDFLLRANARADIASQREAAYYHVFVSGDGPKAIQAAKTNWSLQREPIDVRLLLMAADMVNQPDARQMAEEFITKTGLQDKRLNLSSNNN